MRKQVLITGANGNIGRKLVAAMMDSYELRLLDRSATGDVTAADISVYDAGWADAFQGIDTVIHLAGESQPTASWDQVHSANILGTANVLRAARAACVHRVIFASTNQIMSGYRFSTALITTDAPPAPLNPYAISKLIGEELGRGFAAETGISFVAFRIGNIMPAENIPGPGMGIGRWGQEMWLSNRDMVQAVICAIEVQNLPFAILNLVSNNAGMRWDMKRTHEAIGFVPNDGHLPTLSPGDLADDAEARKAVCRPGEWLDQHFRPLAGLHIKISPDETVVN